MSEPRTRNDCFAVIPFSDGHRETARARPYRVVGRTTPARFLRCASRRVHGVDNRRGCGSYRWLGRCTRAERNHQQLLSMHTALAFGAADIQSQPISQRSCDARQPAYILRDNWIVLLGREFAEAGILVAM